MMDATKKAAGIESFLTQLTGVSRPESIRAGRCVLCRGKAEEFRDPLSVKEFRISGLCQVCQDRVFAPPVEEEE